MNPCRTCEATCYLAFKPCPDCKGTGIEPVALPVAAKVKPQVVVRKPSVIRRSISLVYAKR